MKLRFAVAVGVLGLLVACSGPADDNGVDRIIAPITPDQAAPLIGLERESPRRPITLDERYPAQPKRDLRSSPMRPATRAVAAVACDTNQYAALSGSALVKYIQDAGTDCANKLFTGNSTSFAAFTKANMTAVANSTTSYASVYTGIDTYNLEALYLFLRAGYYVAYYWPNNVDWRNATAGTFDSSVVTVTRYAIDAFVNSGHFYDNSDAHGMPLGEAIILMDSSESQAYYLNVVKEWLYRWNSSYASYWYMRSAVNGIFTILFRGHQNADFRSAVASDTTLISRLSAFVDMTWMLNTDAQFMIENADRELARFLQYKTAAVYSQTQTKIKSILATYTLLHPLYLLAADGADYYDDCNIYGVCTFRADAEAQLLVNNRTCSGTIKIRAQNLSATELSDSCAVLSTEEAYFHQKLATGNTPIAGDQNTNLEVVVFDSSSDYGIYAAVLFQIDTNNGGMYLEGDPSVPGNQARFFCYEAEWVRPAFEIWNLKHEYIHYLDGRFDMKGSFYDYNVDGGKTVWWIEGLGEYVSKKNYNDYAITQARTKANSLGTVFNNTYGSGQEMVYTWGYLAVRFMFENHMADVNTALGYFRAGNYTSYLSWLNGRLNSYDTEWYTWLDTVQSIPDGDTTTPPTAAFSGSPTTVAAGGTVQFTDQSSGPPTSWSWTFTGGTPSSSTSQNPAVVYNTAGTYNVSLTVSNAKGSNSVTKTGFITVTSPCTYSISPASASVAATATTGTVSVTASAGCSWTAVSNTTWITVTSGASGTGNGTVGYSVAANTGTASRTGTVTIAGQTFTVTQAAGGSSCTTYTGTLNGTGDYQYQPNGNWYQTTTTGVHQGTLTGPSGTNFDLQLWKTVNGAWAMVASSAGSSSSETVSYNGTAGYYYWVVTSTSGSGNYSLCLSNP